MASTAKAGTELEGNPQLLTTGNDIDTRVARSSLDIEAAPSTKDIPHSITDPEAEGFLQSKNSPFIKAISGDDIDEIVSQHNDLSRTASTAQACALAKPCKIMHPRCADLYQETKSSSSSSDSGSSTSGTSHATNSDDLDVDNPFKELNDTELAAKVKEFAETSPLLVKALEILKSGAQLAKNKKDFLSNQLLVSELSEEQRDYLNIDEIKTGLWNQSKYLKGSILTACLAGIIQGWTQSAMNGANAGITREFNLHFQDKAGEHPRITKDLWIFGILNATPFIAGGILVPFFSDLLQERFVSGRRGAIAVACLVSIGATIGQSFSTSVAQIIGCRVVTGLTLAVKASSTPLLIAEVAPNHLRGKLLSTWQLSDAFGIFLGFSANLAILNVHAPDRYIWRIEIASTLIPIIVLLFLVYFMPESPRYLMKRGRPAKALDSFTLLRPEPVSHLLGARDFVYAHFQLEMECESINSRAAARKSALPLKAPPPNPEIPKQDDPLRQVIIAEGRTDRDVELGQAGSKKEPALYNISRTQYFQRISQCVRDPRSRRALVCASTAMISQQLCGVNTIAFLSTTLLNSAEGVTASTGAWVGFGLGLANFVFGTPAFYLLDRIGRATMLLLGFIPMFVFMLVLAFSFEEDVSGYTIARVPLVAAFVLLFVIAYSPTAGTSPFAISAEVFPLVVREVGHSLAVAVNFIGLGIVLLFFPSLSDAMGGYRGSLGLFAALNLVAFVLVFLLVPETKDRTLEELRSIFDISTWEHINYRIYCVLPWLFRRTLRVLHVTKQKTTTALPSSLTNTCSEQAPAVREEIGLEVEMLPKFHHWYHQEVKAKKERERQEKQNIEMEAALAATEEEVETKGVNTDVITISP